MKRYIIKMLIYLLIATPVYLLARRPWRYKDKREILLSAFIIYTAWIFISTFEGIYSSPVAMIQTAIQRIRTLDGINIVPFKTISGFFKDSSLDSFCVNIVSNIVLFIPWGFLLPALWEKFRKIKTHLAMCLAITVFIELGQLFIWRNTDIDDIILNFIGGVIGGLTFLIYQNITNKRNSYNE